MEEDSPDTLRRRDGVARFLRGMREVFLRLTSLGNNIDLKAVYDLSPAECGRDVKVICEEFDLASRSDPEQVGRFIESGGVLREWGSPHGQYVSRF